MNIASNLKSILYGFLLFIDQYTDTQNFISQTEGSYVFLAVTGFVIQNFGFAPAIATVVATQALASVINKLVLMITLNTYTPYEDREFLTKNLGAITTIIVSFILFTVVTKLTFTDLPLALAQFTVGLIITFIGGVSYKFFHEKLEDTNMPVAVKILLPGAAALSTVAISLLTISYGFRWAGASNLLEIVRHAEA